MAVDFEATLRSVVHDQRRTALDHAIIGMVAVLMGALGVWAVMGRVPLYAASLSARLEVRQQGSPLEAPVGGKVAESALLLGQSVRQGQILVQLDATLITERIKDAKAGLEALANQLAARREGVVLLANLVGDQQQRSQTTVAQARLHIEQAQAMAEYSLAIADQREQLVRRGDVSRTDYLSAKRDVAQHLAEVKTTNLEVERLSAQAVVDQRESLVRLVELKSSVAELEAAIAAKHAELGALETDFNDHQVRAPLDGLLGEVADLRPGQVVQAGTRLATIVPSGDLIAVAEFAPATAAGRIVPGQMARMTLSGFAWERYGTLPAQVLRVGSEVRGDGVRVELALLPDQQTRMPLQHGLPGEVQIAVGEAPPWQLVLRVMRRQEGRPPPHPTQQPVASPQGTGSQGLAPQGLGE